MKTVKAGVEGVYATLLGERMAALAPVLRRVHVEGGRAEGTFVVARGHGWFRNVLADRLGLPRAGPAVPVTLAIDVEPTRQSWRRTFDGVPLISTQWAQDGVLVEAIGAARFGLRLEVVGDRLRFRPLRCAVFGMRVPVWLAPMVSAVVAGIDDTAWHVTVRVDSKAFGLLCAYNGRMTLQ